ncbi:MAG: hypothetical protein QXQ64_08940, partial [Candidatus Bathyarchaeia archaeon]
MFEAVFRFSFNMYFRLLLGCNLIYKDNRNRLFNGWIRLYFLSDVEHKYLLYQLLPTARDVGVSKELRGWSWHQPP